MIEAGDGLGDASVQLSNFVVRTVWVPPRVVVTLSGELDIASIGTLDSGIEAVLSIRPRPADVLINLRDLSFVDLVGLRALVGWCQQLDQSVTVEVCGVANPVQRVLDLAQLRFPYARDGAIPG